MGSNCRLRNESFGYLKIKKNDLRCIIQQTFTKFLLCVRPCHKSLGTRENQSDMMGYSGSKGFIQRTLNTGYILPLPVWTFTR